MVSIQSAYLSYISSDQKDNEQTITISFFKTADMGLGGTAYFFLPRQDAATPYFDRSDTVTDEKLNLYSRMKEANPTGYPGFAAIASYLEQFAQPEHDCARYRVFRVPNIGDYLNADEDMLRVADYDNSRGPSRRRWTPASCSRRRLRAASPAS